MPFRNLTGNPDLDHLGQMASHFLTQELARTGLVEVRSYESVVLSDRYVRSQSDGGGDSDHTAAFASEVGAGTVVHGTFILNGGQLQFDASIDDVATRKRMRSIAPVRGDPASPSQAIGELRPRVMGALAMEFDPALEPYVDQIFHSPTDQAAREFARGMHLYLVDHDYREALRRLLRAHELDPSFYSPLVMASWVSANVRGRRGRALQDSIRQLLFALQLELSPYEQALVEAWRGGEDFVADPKGGGLERYLRGYEEACNIAPGSKACFNYGKSVWEWENAPLRAAEVLTERLEPEKGWMRGWVSYWTVLCATYLTAGRYDMALEVVEKMRGIYRQGFERSLVLALAGLGRVDETLRFLEDSLPLLFPDRNPLLYTAAGPLARQAGMVLHHEGYAGEADRVWKFSVEWYEDLLLEDPDNRTYHSWIGWGLYLLGRLEEAEDHFIEAARLNPTSAGLQAALGMVAAKRGDHEEGRRVMAWLDAHEWPVLYPTLNDLYGKARIAEAMGEKAEAVGYLRELRDLGPRDGWNGGIGDRLAPLLPGLHGYQPFEDLYWPRNR
jgi:tetratricopeptide (TPR) repeat protein